MTMLSKTPQPVYEGNPVCHGCWDLILNLEGSGIMTADKQTFSFEKGTLFCIPPNVMHEKSSANGYTDIHVYSNTFLSGYDDCGIIALQDDELNTARSLFFQMQKLYDNHTAVHMKVMEELYHALLTWITLQRNANEAPFSVQEITRKLEQNFSDPAYSVVSLLQNCDYCPDYLRRLFKRHHGCSPLEYMNRLRLEHAKKLLSTNRLNAYSIPQIAWMSGFNDPNYFVRIFKKRIGLTPLQYAKKYSN